MNFLADEICRELEKKGMSKYRLAKTSGISASSMRRKLRGERVFDVIELAAIGKALNMKGSTLMRRAEQAAQACAEEASGVSS